MADGKDTNARGRRAALFLVAVAVFWILFTALGNEYEWSQRTRALFDLIALAGFGYGLWQGIKLWRDSRGE